MDILYTIHYTLYTIQCTCSLLNVTQNISIQWHDLNGVFRRSLGIRKYTFFDDFYDFAFLLSASQYKLNFDYKMAICIFNTDLDRLDFSK